jgi:hypothetical protein
MKAAIWYFASAVVVAAIGALCLEVGWLQRDLARAQQLVAAQKYAEADSTFARAERYFELTGRVPGLGHAPLNRIRARRAALRYWQGQYLALAPDEGDPTIAVPADNIDLQFVVANAVYRARTAEAHDRPATVEALTAGINAQLVVLKNAMRREDAAFNYEYLLRLRDEFERSRRKPDVGGGESESPLGSEASPERTQGDMKSFKTYVPLTPTELDKADSGRGQPVKRKG